MNFGYSSACTLKWPGIWLHILHQRMSSKHANGTFMQSWKTPQIHIHWGRDLGVYIVSKVPESFGFSGFSEEPLGIMSLEQISGRIYP